ncbi:hypothetical protein, partial [Bradyrhizobium lablabi]|uniref:hypothetical protein n=1 Tax=Bradyrhizobium lablabi TaxID=722472 RepID=UPI001BA7E95F
MEVPSRLAASEGLRNRAAAFIESPRLQIAIVFRGGRWGKLKRDEAKIFTICRSLILPVEASAATKNIALPSSGKSVVQFRPSHPIEGRFAIVTSVAVRCGG